MPSLRHEGHSDWQLNYTGGLSLETRSCCVCRSCVLSCPWTDCQGAPEVLVYCRARPYTLTRLYVLPKYWIAYMFLQFCRCSPCNIKYSNVNMATAHKKVISCSLVVLTLLIFFTFTYKDYCWRYRPILFFCPASQNIKYVFVDKNNCVKHILPWLNVYVILVYQYIYRYEEVPKITKIKMNNVIQQKTLTLI